MDLHIEKMADFHVHGKVSTRTYVKPHHNAQYLAYHSQHADHTKHGIFKSEMNRHLLICSKEADYRECVDKLASSLRKRGYPSEMLMPIAYDSNRRTQALTALHNRSVDVDKRTNTDEGVVIFKCPFSPLIRRLRIRVAYERLLSELRRELGEMFLQNSRLVIAHSVKTNLFLESYRYNNVRSMSTDDICVPASDAPT